MKIYYLLLGITCANSYYVSKDSFREEYLLGGQLTKISQISYQAAFEFDKKFKCAAIIISFEWLLSSAQCLVNYPEYLTRGLIRTGTSFKEFGGRLYKIRQIVLYPYFNNETIDNDIALIELDGYMLFDKYQARIQLATPCEFTTLGDKMIISGFEKLEENSNAKSQLESAIAEIISYRDCEIAYRAYNPNILSRNMFCGMTQKVEICKEDVGGPVMYQRMLFGVISYPASCRNSSLPSIFTKISKYYSWIDLYVHID